MKCSGCNTPGKKVGPLLPWEDCFDLINREMENNKEDATLLIENGGGYFCYPCHCKIVSHCFQCDESVNTLYIDKRCKSQPYVCKECVEREKINHVWKCYNNGCISPGELAQQEYEMMMEDADEAL